jgi:hypothetical protein
VDVELLHERLAMARDGLHADAEFRRDLFVGFALRRIAPADLG